MNNTEFYGKILNFDCKDTNLKSYNYGTQNLRVSFRGGSDNLC